MLRRLFGLRMRRSARTRRLLLRLILLLTALVFLSLVALLWFSISDAPDENGAVPAWQRPFRGPAGEREEERDEDVVIGPNGKIPFRHQAAVSTTVAPSATEEADGGDARRDPVWFSPDTVTGHERNASWPDTVFASTGVARVALPFSIDASTGAAAPQPPRLFGFLAAWQTYERVLVARGATGDDVGAAADVEAESPAHTRRRVGPVKHVEVRLLRQRASRGKWAAAGKEMDPIVGILPRESTTLMTAEEVLVPSALTSEGLEPLVAALQPGSGSMASSAVVGIDTQARAAAAAAAVHRDPGSPLPRPLVELASVPRRPTSIPSASAVASADVSPTTALLRWRADDAAALAITLDMVYPGRPSMDAAPLTPEEAGGGGGGATAHGGAPDSTHTAVLEVTVCSARLVRLYGLAPSSSAFAAAAAATAAPGSAADRQGDIPLDMTAEVEVMVGGAHLSGVVPLLYMELSTGSSGASAHHTVGLLWLHPGPFTIATATSPALDETEKEPRRCVRLRGTAGATGLYLLPGPTPAEVLRQYYTLTGFPTLPPRFLLGYHHGRRGAAATTAAATEDLSDAFRGAGVPLDSVWISDPAVAARGTPFTWNHTRFPDPLQLQSNLWYAGRRYLVVRAAPTVPITTRSPLFLEGRRGGFFVSMNAEESAGWPTLSVDGVASLVVDFANPAARMWYGGMIKYRRYVGSSNHTFFDIQHGAPTVLAGTATAETALLPMDVGHYGGVQHRQVHQLLAVYFARATHEGMLRRTQYHRRALAFAESYYAGTQRYAVVRVEARSRGGVEAAPDPRAAAAGDDWRALQAAVRQCAQLAALGIPFSGANLADGAAALQGGGGGDPTPAAGSAADVQQLPVRWHQAAVFWGVMYADESSSSAAAVGELRQAAAAPWWMRLPADAATRQAIQATIHARYALLPYLYTAAYHASEGGAPFWAPLAFAPSAASPTSAAQHEVAAPTCYVTGSALLVCPVTTPVPPLSSTAPPTSDVAASSVEGLFDLWTGVWHTAASSAAGRASWWAAAAAALTSSTASRSGKALTAPLAWLAVSDTVPPHALPTPGSLPPVLLQRGHIVATQNVVGVVAQDDSVAPAGVQSTHMGANWTLTVALPPLPPGRGAAPPPSPVLLAEGDVFWDEGSRNSQHPPPAPAPGTPPPLDRPRIPEMVQHCALRIRCFYEAAVVGQEASGARLVLEVAQTSDSCPQALAELALHWREEPQGYAERLQAAMARRDARVHQMEVERDAQEDRGQPARRGGGARAPVEGQRWTAADLQGLRVPDADAEAARNSAWASHLLQRVRFLFHSSDDAARLMTRPAPEASGTTVVVVADRRGRSSSSSHAGDCVAGNPSARTDSGDVARIAARASYQNSDAHTVIMDVLPSSDNETASTPLFGVRTVTHSDDIVRTHVPPCHTWDFAFPLTG